MSPKSGIEIYQSSDGQTEIEVAFENETVWLSQYAKGLKLLDDYDHERLDSTGLTKKDAAYPTKEDYKYLISQMKAEFRSDVFAVEKDYGFDSAINQISKGFGEQDFYPTIEEKAATLLYLVTKNHAFADGNKRIAAACFLLFLEKNGLLSGKEGRPVISNEALASVTLFVAISKPDEMDAVKKLIVSILNRNI
jgi:prophage maintenance system killer protein